MEKAHRDVLNLLLQVLDDGRLTDSKGTVVDFKNTVIIFTSNVGSQAIVDIKDDGTEEGGGRGEEMRRRVQEAMRREFTPEFLNRCETVIFNSLGRKELRGIVRLEMQNLEDRVKDRGFKIEVGDEVLDYLAEIGFDGVFGARPLKRIIQREVERGLAKMILSSEVNDGDTVVVGIDENDRVSLKVVDNPTSPDTHGKLRILSPASVRPSWVQGGTPP